MNVVRDLRTASGLSQEELGRRSGVAQPNIAAYEAGRRRPSAHMLDRLRRACQPRPSESLREHRARVIEILAGHGLSAPLVFGSAARGDDEPDSDVDLIVDIGPDGTLLDLIDAAEELEALLGSPVDLVTSRALPADHEIRRTAVPL